MTARLGAIVIAAYNEEAVIARTLAPLMPGVEEGSYDVHVICNGCTDATAEVATRSGARVTEIAVASKTAALREGDRTAPPGPRIYLDADVVLTRRAAEDTLRVLGTGAIAGRPPHRFDASRATWAVRRWYAVRAALPSISSALWGAGCYGLSVEGRSRFTEFPDIVSDDLFIDQLFERSEITIVDTDPVVVTTPRRLYDLIRILQRTYRTQAEVVATHGPISTGQREQLEDIGAAVRRDPSRLADAVIYLWVILRARRRARRSGAIRWERDTSSRESG